MGWTYLKKTYVNENYHFNEKRLPFFFLKKKSHVYDVCNFVVFGDTSTVESKRHEFHS